MCGVKWESDLACTWAARKLCGRQQSECAGSFEYMGTQRVRRGMSTGQNGGFRFLFVNTRSG